jgi:hypothetical protein
MRCFLLAIQESTSLKELDIELPRGAGPSNLALENMLTHPEFMVSESKPKDDRSSFRLFLEVLCMEGVSGSQIVATF